MPPPENTPRPPNPDDSGFDPPLPGGMGTTAGDRLVREIRAHISSGSTEPQHLRDLATLEQASVEHRKEYGWLPEAADEQNAGHILYRMMRERILDRRVEGYHQGGKLSVASEHIILVSRMVKEVNPEGERGYMIGSGILELHNADFGKLLSFVDFSTYPRWQLFPDDAPIVYEVYDTADDDSAEYRYNMRFSPAAFEHDLGLVISGQALDLQRKMEPAGSNLCNRILSEVLDLVEAQERPAWQANEADAILDGTLLFEKRPSPEQVFFRAENTFGVFKAVVKWSKSSGLVNVTAQKV
ncbi:hypothetical protein OAO01_06520 [Oligoflexia bacterium]|nr:hypothetical protein [Oligoflexia bacterium]